jgi:hypothetical protein
MSQKPLKRPLKLTWLWDIADWKVFLVRAVSEILSGGEIPAAVFSPLFTPLIVPSPIHRMMSTLFNIVLLLPLAALTYFSQSFRRIIPIWYTHLSVQQEKEFFIH